MAGHVLRSLAQKLKHPNNDSDTSATHSGRSSSEHNRGSVSSIGSDFPTDRKPSITDDYYSTSSPRESRRISRVGPPNGRSNSGSPAGFEAKLKTATHDIKDKLHLNGSSTRSNSDSSPRRTMNDGPQPMSKNQMRKQEKRVEMEHKKEEHKREQDQLRRRREEEQAKAEREDTQEMRSRYGILPVNAYAANEWQPHQKTMLLHLKRNQHVGQQVYFRARVHNVRKMSAKMCFLVFRDQTATIQGVLQTSEVVSKHMVYWAEHVPVESIVLVRGVIQEPKAKEGEVVGTLIHDMEVVIHELKMVSQLSEHLPFTVAEAETTEIEASEENSTRHYIGSRARLQNRILDLRTTSSQAVFRLQSGICSLFRSYLDSQGFMEIHTPKLQGGATESGASVFKLNYFGREAFLAQSPQLAKQMSIAADFPRVYEIGAVFRAENSNTHRHLTEYTGLDIEMAIDEHYWEVRTMIDRTLKTIFKGVYERFPHEIEQIKRQYPHEDLVWLEQTPVFRFKNAIQMLNDSGWTDDDGQPLPLDEDLGTRDEIQLGRVIKEKFHTDYYIIDKFPASARPFYTMPDPNDPTYTNSFDIFVRGQEIISGGQRVHDAALLLKQMEKAKIDPLVMEDYLTGFQWGAPPHGGAGIGLERLLMLLFQLGDIRNASMYPRDPRSLPAKQVVRELRHPEASTLHPPWESQEQTSGKKELQPLEMLIANYGDASNTSWLEPRTKIWRDDETGAAIGYVPQNGYAMTVGDPLCHASQYTRILASYLEFIKRDTDLKPLWVLCGTEVSDVLGDHFDWRTLSCAAEQRLNLSDMKADKEHDIQRKVRHALKEGIKMHDIPIGTRPGHDVIDKCNKRIEDWLGNRKDHQHVHLTDVHPWDDIPHRQYHYAMDKSGTIHALVVLAQLSIHHGWQVKWMLDFPDAPSGTIEATIIHALNALKSSGVKEITFGGAASKTFIPGHHLKGAKIKVLSKAYTEIEKKFKLTQKSEFREKLGTEEDPIWVCYPPRGLGPKGVHAIMSFFGD